MNLTAARWNLVVSPATDAALRQFLASQGRARKGEVSRFVEEAAHARILEIEADQTKARNAAVWAGAIETAIDEALDWTRRA